MKDYKRPYNSPRPGTAYVNSDGEHRPVKSLGREQITDESIKEYFGNPTMRVVSFATAVSEVGLSTDLPEKAYDPKSTRVAKDGLRHGSPVNPYYKEHVESVKAVEGKKKVEADTVVPAVRFAKTSDEKTPSETQVRRILEKAKRAGMKPSSQEGKEIEPVGKSKAATQTRQTQRIIKAKIVEGRSIL